MTSALFKKLVLVHFVIFLGTHWVIHEYILHFSIHLSITNPVGISVQFHIFDHVDNSILFNHFMLYCCWHLHNLSSHCHLFLFVNRSLHFQSHFFLHLHSLFLLRWNIHHRPFTFRIMLTFPFMSILHRSSWRHFQWSIIIDQMTNDFVIFNEK